MRAFSISQLERDLLALGLLARLHLGFVERAAPCDLAALRIFFGLDALFGDVALLRQPRLLDRLARDQLRLLGLLVADGALAHQLGALRGAADLDLAFLLEPRIFGLAVDLQHLPLRVEVLVADVDQRALLDLVAHLAAVLDRFRQLRQALGVEGVGRVEIFEAGLVEVDDRHAFQLETVEGERLAAALAHPRCIVAALLVHFLQRHLRGDGAHRRRELAFQQLANAFGLQRAAAERLRGGGDQLRGSRRRARRTRRSGRRACGFW